MNDAWRRIGPVLLSIAIIIVIAVFRERSRVLAAITATMPINVALALYLIYVAEGTDQAAVVDFVRSMVFGVIGTLVWLLAVWVAARAGWRLPRLLLVGYVAWAVVIGAIFALQSWVGGSSIFPP
jgi:hypothetical protein